MTTAEEIRELGIRARAAAAELRPIPTEQKNKALEEIANSLEEMKDAIDAANAEDVKAAIENGLSAPMVDRLTLTPSRFASMVQGVRDIINLPDPVGEIIKEVSRPVGIEIRKVREPFGVIAVVFESRPNVFVDTAALCLKTSNAIILRGGREALRSNMALNEAVRAGLAKAGLPADAVQLVKTTDHAGVTELVRSVGLVDVAIPRGGERLITAMCEAALIPVLKHYKGVCHVYVDESADLEMALKVLDNSKVQRPSACNAAECLLLNEKIADQFMPMVEKWAEEKKVTLHKECDNPDYSYEYLSLDINVKKVKDINEAVKHINKYGSHHSDAIVTGDEAKAKAFLRDVDSAAVYWNVSTRFTDGAEFGMGAEIGISTDKLHARGPMGLEELTSYKYVVTGDGIIRP
ncbi:MAG: glutamate-5-semialdehyde dehydrogenase [Kiritimatiellae bacterium]|nr:glutamate-5-semialdehyde dehydrogenase [Kiritimatiellia bacterium]